VLSDGVAEKKDDSESVSRAELEKTRHETALLRQEARLPWIARVGAPILLASLASGLGGYLFGDSLHDRSRAEVRTEVLKIYFGVENEVVGKRAQLLTFVDTVLARDDPELAVWVKQERAVVDDARKKVDALLAEAETRIATLEAEIAESEACITPDSPEEATLDLQIKRESLAMLKEARVQYRRSIHSLIRGDVDERRERR
jgi:hypothetical protein